MLSFTSIAALIGSLLTFSTDNWRQPTTNPHLLTTSVALLALSIAASTADRLIEYLEETREQESETAEETR